jgi:hypothetical protein
MRERFKETGPLAQVLAQADVNVHLAQLELADACFPDLCPGRSGYLTSYVACYIILSEGRYD